MKKISFLIAGIISGVLFLGGVFASEGRQEITMYESYDNSIQDVLIDDETKIVKTVPHNLGDVQIDARGRIKVSSIQSYSFEGIQSLCSLAVKLFLQEVTGLKPFQGVTADQNRLWKGDAIRLIESGIKQELLREMPKEYREVRRFLTQMRQKNLSHSMIDVFIYTGNDKATYESEAWYLQGHRIVVFLGSDAYRYVYDPFVSPYTTTPHRLKEYIASDLWSGGVPYTLSHGYAPAAYEHFASSAEMDSMQERLDQVVDTIHENTLGEFEDYASDVVSLFDVMKRPLPPLI